MEILFGEIIKLKPPVILVVMRKERKKRKKGPLFNLSNMI